MRRLVLVLACTFVVITGCTDSASDDSGSTELPSTERVQAADGDQFEVDPLGLAFALPESFSSVDDDDYLFFAESLSPRSLFSIDGASEAITDYSVRAGETLSDPQLPGVDAVIVTDAALEGLPDGISANELLVSNGSQSFSAIMSAPSEDLPELWDYFVRSVQVTPAD